MVDHPSWMMGRQEVDVDVDSLVAFGKKIEGELTGNIVPNNDIILTRLAGGGYDASDPSAAAIQAQYGPHRNATDAGQNLTFGVDPRQGRARNIGNYHLQCESQAYRLLADLATGFQAIAWAAQSIAQDYQSVDEQNGMDVAKVKSYFKADGGGFADRHGTGDDTDLPRGTARAV